MCVCWSVQPGSQEAILVDPSKSNQLFVHTFQWKSNWQLQIKWHQLHKNKVYPHILCLWVIKRNNVIRMQQKTRQMSCLKKHFKIILMLIFRDLYWFLFEVLIHCIMLPSVHHYVKDAGDSMQMFWCYVPELIFVLCKIIKIHGRFRSRIPV